MRRSRAVLLTALVTTGTSGCQDRSTGAPVDTSPSATTASPPPGSTSSSAPSATTTRAAATASLPPRATSSTTDSGPRPWSEQRLTDDELEQRFAQGDLDPDVVVLDLAGNRLTATGLARLAAQPIEQLRHLSLSRNFVGDEGVTLIATDQRFAKLERLNLARCGLTKKGVATLFAPKSKLTELAVVQLSNNQVGDEGARTIAQSPRAAKLTTLHLDEADLTPAGVAALMASPYLVQLRLVTLQHNGLPATLADTMRQSLAFRSCQIRIGP